MAISTTVHVNDVGVVFLLTIEDESGIVDLTTAQTISLYFQKPDKSVIERTCTVVNATAGLLKYVNVAGDFDQAGRWNVQLVISFSNNNLKHSSIGVLTVANNLFSL